MRSDEAVDKASLAVRVAAALACVALAALLTHAVLAIPHDEPGVAPLVMEHMPVSGVENPVTAVLLNFRAYDTLLEIGVLVLATIGVLSLGASRPNVWAPVAEAANPVLGALVRTLSPVMVLVAGYLLWLGAYAPGGAFQAGAILGGAGILLALAGYARPAWIGRFALRLIIVVGFLVFLVIAAVGIMLDGMLLEYPAGQAKTYIFVVETWLTLSIAVILASLFIVSASSVEELRRRREGRER